VPDSDTHHFRGLARDPRAKARRPVCPGLAFFCSTRVNMSASLPAADRGKSTTTEMGKQF
jgi:hypothetical protein